MILEVILFIEYILGFVEDGDGPARGLGALRSIYSLRLSYGDSWEARKGPQ